MHPNSRDLIATINLRQLDSLHLGIIRALFPAFAENIELGRYIRRLLSDGGYAAVHLEPHRDGAGRVAPHVFDVFVMRSTATPEPTRVSPTSPGGARQA